MVAAAVTGFAISDRSNTFDLLNANVEALANEKLLQLGIVLEILVIVMQVVVYAEHPYPAKVI